MGSGVGLSYLLDVVIGDGNSSEGVKVLVVAEVTVLGDEDLSKVESGGETLILHCSLSFSFRCGL